jgi:hypothetical protein
MKYLPEQSWEPYEKEVTARSIKRAKKKFFERIKKKASKSFKHIWNNHLSDSDKDRIYNMYDTYLIDIEKECSIDRVLSRLVNNNIIDEKISKIIKRKWIISKLFDEKLGN